MSLGCCACLKGGIGKVLLDERDAEFFAPPAGWFLCMGEGQIPEHVTALVYCTEACARAGQPWATEWFEKDLRCWECGKTVPAPGLGAPTSGKRKPQERVCFVLVPGWFALSADGGELAPGKVLILTYCSEACVRKVNALQEEMPL